MKCQHCGLVYPRRRGRFCGNCAQVVPGKGPFRAVNLESAILGVLPTEGEGATFAQVFAMLRPGPESFHSMHEFTAAFVAMIEQGRILVRPRHIGTCMLDHYLSGRESTS